MRKTILYSKVILSSRQILFQISQVFSLLWVWHSAFLKKEEGQVRAHFISFVFIIHTTRDRRNMHTRSILSDVSSGKSLGRSLKGALQWGCSAAPGSAGGVPQSYPYSSAPWAPSSTGTSFLVTCVRPVALYPKIFEWLQYLKKFKRCVLGVLFYVLQKHYFLIWQ